MATREFVVNSEQMAKAMNITCVDAPADIEELSLAGLTAVPSSRVRTPRVEGSPVAFECVLSLNQFIAIGRIVQAHVGDPFVLDAAKHLFDARQPTFDTSQNRTALI